MKLSTLFTLAIVGMLTFVSKANAQVVLNDTFTQANGTSLTGTVPNPGPGGVWTDHSGTTGDLLIQNGAAVIQHGIPSEDTHSTFGVFTSGNLSANFDVTVNSDVAWGDGDTDFEYFAHFQDLGTFDFWSRLSVVAPMNGGDYTFGLATEDSTEEAFFGSDFSFGQTINGTLTYDWGTGLSSFTVGGTTLFSTSVLFAPELESFALRQSDSSINETVIIDNLVVTYSSGAVPEPGSFAVLSLIGLAGVAKRRRK